MEPLCDPPDRILNYVLSEKYKVVTGTRMPKLKSAGGRYLYIADIHIFFFVLSKKMIDIV